MKNHWIFWWTVGVILMACIVASCWWIVLTVIQLRMAPGSSMLLPTQFDQMQTPPPMREWDCTGAGIVNAQNNPDVRLCVAHQPKG